MFHALRVGARAVSNYYEVVRPCSDASLLLASRMTRFYLFT
jgi:hypothetical protein